MKDADGLSDEDIYARYDQYQDETDTLMDRLEELDKKAGGIDNEEYEYSEDECNALYDTGKLTAEEAEQLQKAYERIEEIDAEVWTDDDLSDDEIEARYAKYDDEITSLNAQIETLEKKAGWYEGSYGNLSEDEVNQLNSIYNKIDVTMLNILATDESVGYYTYAQKTIIMVLTMANAITAALLPRLSYYYDNDRQGFYKLLDKGFQVLCFMTFPMTVGMALVAPQAVEFLYGEAFEPAVLTIRLMCPLILIKGFGDLFCYQLVYSTKSEKIILPASASASVINIITNAALIPTLLQNGAVIASVFSELVTNAVQFIYMKKKVKFTINMKALTKGLISTAVMTLSVYIIMQFKLPNTIGLILEILCGVIAYTAVNLVMKNTLIFEIVNKVKGKISHKA